MKKYALEHLDDVMYEEKMDYIYDRIRNTVTEVLDEWIKEGIINEEDKQITLEDFKDEKLDLFNYLLGEA